MPRWGHIGKKILRALRQPESGTKVSEICREHQEQRGHLATRPNQWRTMDFVGSGLYEGRWFWALTVRSVHTRIPAASGRQFAHRAQGGHSAQLDYAVIRMLHCDQSVSMESSIMAGVPFGHNHRYIDQRHPVTIRGHDETSSLLSSLRTPLGGDGALCPGTFHVDSPISLAI